MTTAVVSSYRKGRGWNEPPFSPNMLLLVAWPVTEMAMSRKPKELGSEGRGDATMSFSENGVEREIDETLERLGVGIDREIEKMDELLARLRRTRIAA